MPWSRKAKRQAVLLIGVVVPGLMFGLGIGGFLLARAAGLEGIAIWIALAMSTAGLIISGALTLSIGKMYERENKSKNDDRLRRLEGSSRSDSGKENPVA